MLSGGDSLLFGDDDFEDVGRPPGSRAVHSTSMEKSVAIILL